MLATRPDHHIIFDSATSSDHVAPHKATTPSYTIFTP